MYVVCEGGFFLLAGGPFISLRDYRPNCFMIWCLLES